MYFNLNADKTPLNLRNRINNGGVVLILKFRVRGTFFPRSISFAGDLKGDGF